MMLSTVPVQYLFCSVLCCAVFLFVQCVGNFSQNAEYGDPIGILHRFAVFCRILSVSVMGTFV
jgi:hypothetical protein